MTDNAADRHALAGVIPGITIGDGVLLGLGFMSRTLRYQTSHGDIVLKRAAPETSGLANAFNSFEKEIAFYRRKDYPLRRPALHGAHLEPDSPASFALAIEFLGAGEPIDQAAGLTPRQVAAAMDALVTLHAHYWGQAATLPRFAIAAIEVERTYGETLAASRDHLPSQVHGYLARWISEVLPALHHELEETLVHCDYRADNLWWDGDSIVPLDWGDHAAGPALYDVTTLLGTSVAADWRGANEHAIVTDYAQRLLATGIEKPAAAAWDDYRRLIPAVFYNVLLLATLPASHAQRQLLAITRDRGCAQIMAHLDFLQAALP